MDLSLDNSRCRQVGSIQRVSALIRAVRKKGTLNVELLRTPGGIVLHEGGANRNPSIVQRIVCYRAVVGCVSS